MKITADTNFLISATQWDNSIAFKLLIRLLELNAEIFTTREILGEFTEVLQRDFNYNNLEIKKIIEKLSLFVEIINPKEKVKIIEEDPDDNKIIECAISSNSDFI